MGIRRCILEPFILISLEKRKKVFKKMFELALWRFTTYAKGIKNNGKWTIIFPWKTK